MKWKPRCTQTFTWIFVAALLVTGKTGEKPSVPQQVAGTLTLDHHSAGRKELLTPRHGRNLKVMVLSERSPATKNASCVIPFIEHSGKHKLTYRDRKQLSGCLGVLGARRAHPQRGTRELLEDGGCIRRPGGSDGWRGRHLRHSSPNCAV